ncbi:MAG TPA: small multi-drug export protein [Methanoregulaceae archaeon]|nr:small multi-drug export protein [Methanoregulaceae archaeon]
MEKNTRYVIQLQIGKILASILLISIALPLALGLLLDINFPRIISFIGSTALLQAAAAPVGLLLDFDAWVVLFIMVSFALGMVLAIWEICQTFALTSERVKIWIDKVEQKTRSHPIIYKYGALSCIFIAWIPGIGLYGTPVIAWILRWNRVPATFFTILGFFIASLIVMILAQGISFIFG